MSEQVSIPELEGRVDFLGKLVIRLLEISNAQEARIKELEK